MDASIAESHDDSHYERGEAELATPNPGPVDQLSRILSTLANGNRRAIVEYLAQHGHKGNSPPPISRIAENVLLTRFSTSRHLRILQEAGLVDVNRSGAAKLSVLSVEPLLRVEDWIIAVTGTHDDVLDHGWVMGSKSQD